MKITIDASPLLSATETGGARYTRKLINAIAQLSEDTNNNEYVLFFQTFKPSVWKYYESKKSSLSNPNFSFKTTRFPRYLLEILWDKIGLRFPPIEYFSGKSDIFHSISYRAPLTKNSKLISTIFDLTVIKMPFLYPDSVKPFYFWVKKAAERSDMIITISHSSKKDIVELLGIPPSKIAVTYLAHDEKFKPISDKTEIAKVVAKYGIAAPYILYVGTLGRNKNLPRLVRAFKIFKERLPDAAHKLVIVGAKAWRHEEITQSVIETGLSGDVIMPGYVDEIDLPFIYNGCDAFAYVSLYEGFGLPALEAMACGKPSVLSGNSSLPEVAQDAAILVNPLDIGEIADAFIKLFSDDNYKKTLSRKAIERASQFSWKRCASETLGVYSSLL